MKTLSILQKSETYSKYSNTGKHQQTLGQCLNSMIFGPPSKIGSCALTSQNGCLRVYFVSKPALSCNPAHSICIKHTVRMSLLAFLLFAGMTCHWQEIGPWAHTQQPFVKTDWIDRDCLCPKFSCLSRSVDLTLWAHLPLLPAPAFNLTSVDYWPAMSPGGFSHKNEQFSPFLVWFLSSGCRIWKNIGIFQKMLGRNSWTKTTSSPGIEKECCHSGPQCLTAKFLSW